jgi:hypothetical protein
MKEDPLAAKQEERPLNDGEEEPLATIIINSQPPWYQKVERCYDDEKVCRICLEDDHPERMISPCKCKGGSKWVHRECLDEWRLNEKDRAFSKCTECLFQYHMQPVHPNRKADWKRKVKFYMLVSRDVCFLTILLQFIIGLLGGFLVVCDPNQSIPDAINNGQHPIAAYYLCGWLFLLVVLGFYGSVVLCMNGCSPTKALGNQGQQQQQDDNPTYAGRSAAYSQRRHHHEDSYLCCYAGQGPYYHHHPMYIGDGGGGCCCCCCDGQSNANATSQNHSRGGGGGGGSNCDCDCCPSNSGGGGDAAYVLVIVLLVVAVIMAVIGFFVGLIITVVVCQRIIQRHIYLLHKRQLVQEFQVVDLAGYDLERPAETPSPSAPPSAYDMEQPPPEPEIHVAPSAPILRETDASFLKKLGLMD